MNSKINAVAAMAVALLAVMAAVCAIADASDVDGAVGQSGAASDAEAFEFGFSLQLTDDVAYEALRVFAIEAPDMFSDNGLIEFLKENPDLTMEEAIQIFEPEVSGMDSSGELYVLVTGAPTADGYGITFLCTGSVMMTAEIQIQERDPEHPDIPLGSTVQAEVDISAAAAVSFTEDMVPVSADMSYGLDYGLRLDSNYTTEFDYDLRQYMYLYVGDYVRDEDVVMTEVLSVELFGMTSEMFDDLLYGDTDVPLDLSIRQTSTRDIVNSGRFYDIGSESRGTMHVHGGLLSDSSVSEGLIPDLPGSGSVLPDYTSVQVLLEGWGFFLSEEEYDSFSDALGSVYDILSADSLDFYYVVGGSGYNTAIADGISAQLSDVKVDGVDPVGVDGEFSISYYRQSSEGPYIIQYFQSDSQSAPSTIHGVDAVVEGEVPDVQLIAEQDGVAYYANGNSVTAVVTASEGDVQVLTSLTSEGTEFDVDTIRIDDRLLDSVTIQIVGEQDVSVYIEGSTVDSLVLGSLAEVDDYARFELYLTEAYLESVDVTAVADLNLEVTSWADSSIGSMTFESSSDGSDGSYSHIQLYDLDVGSMSVLSPWVYLSMHDVEMDSLRLTGVHNITIDHYIEGSSIGTISYGADGPYDVSLYWMNDLVSLGDLILEGDIEYVYGTITVSGYSGLGSYHSSGGMTYELTVRSGEYEAEIVSVDAENIVILDSIVVDDVIYGVVDCGWYSPTFDGVISISFISVPDMSIESSTLEVVTFDNVEKVDIPDWMFDTIYSLETVVFNGPVGTIGGHAFYQCSEIRDLQFNSSVDVIEDAFFPLSRVTSLTFKGDVGTIYDGVFSGFTRLESVVFEGNVDSISYGAFSENEALASIHVKGNLGYIDSQDETHSLVSIDVDGDVGEIEAGAFYDKVPYEVVDGEMVELQWFFSVGGHVGIIGGSAFRGSSIGSFIASGGIGEIDEFAFVDTALTVFDIGQSSIGYVDFSAFSNTVFEPSVFDALLSKVENAHTDAFRNVIFDDGSFYKGPSSGSGMTTIDGDIEYYVMPFICNSETSLEIISIFNNSPGSAIVIPCSLVCDGIELPVKSVGFYYGWYASYPEGEFTLEVPSEIVLIGEGLGEMLSDCTITEVRFAPGSGFTADYNADLGIISIIHEGAEGLEVVSILNRPDIIGDTYTIPEGVEEFDLGLFDELSFRKLVTGDSLKVLHGALDRVEGLEYLEIGASLQSFVDYWIPDSLKYISVDPSNETYVSDAGVLYRIENNEEQSLDLIRAPPSLVSDPETSSETGVQELVIPDHIDTGKGKIPVTDIGFYAFSYSNLTKLTICNNIKGLNGSPFNHSSISEIVVPYDIRRMSLDAFSDMVPGLDVHSLPDESGLVRVYTVDGAIYHLRTVDYSYNTDGTLNWPEEPRLMKTLVTYVGDSDVLVVEDGTEEADFGRNVHGDPIYIFLPQETREVDDHAWSSDDSLQYLFVPSAAIQNSNYYALCWIFRTYQVSSDYSFGFTVSDAGVTVDVQGYPQTTVNGLMLDGNHYENGHTFAIADLFPSVPEDGYVYEGVLTVDYDIESYEVTFVYGGGLTDQTVEVGHGHKVDIPEDPVRGGFEFTGWYADPGLTEPFDFETVITGPVSIYAGWLGLYTVTVVSEGVDFYMDGHLINGSTIADEGVHSFWFQYREGYIGNHQMYADGVPFDGDLMVTENIDLSADVRPEPTHHRITLLNDPSKGACDVTYVDIPIGEPIGESVSLPTPEANDSYRFVGWVLDHRIVGDGEYLDDDVTLEAAYVRSGDDVSVTFSFDSSMGKADPKPRDTTVPSGTAVELPEVEAKHGYMFIGWSVDGDVIGGDRYTVTSDVRFIALFSAVDRTPETPTLTLHIDRSEGQFSGRTSLDMSPGEEYVLPEIEGKRGFSLVSWSIDGVAHPAGTVVTVTESLTATAIFQRTSDEPVTHTVSFVMGAYQGSMDSGTSVIALDMQNIQLPDVEPRDGYVFDGWYADGVLLEDGYLTVSSDTVVVAMFHRESGGQGSGPDPGEGDTTVSVDQAGNVVTETVHEDGSVTTVITSTDGSATQTDVVWIDGGKQTTEKVFDVNGDLTGTTTMTETSSVLESGTKVDIQTVETADGNGNNVTETTRLTATSPDGGVTTDMSIADGEVSASTTVRFEDDGRGTVSLGDAAVEDVLGHIDELRQEYGDVPASIVVRSEGYTPMRAEAVMSAEALALISDAEATVTVSGDSGSVTIGPSLARSLSSDGGDVSVSVAMGNKATMTREQQIAVGNHPVFELTASVGGESLHEFGDDVTVTLPYTLRDWEHPDDIRVYYLDDDGGLHVISTTYDPATHTVSFVTDHFSAYAIGNVNEIDGAPVTTAGDGFTMIHYPDGARVDVIVTGVLSDVLGSIEAAVSGIGIDSPDVRIAVGALEGEDPSVLSRISAMGATLAVIGEDGTVYLDAAALSSLAGTPGPVTVAVVKEQAAPASASDDGAVYRLDVLSGGDPVSPGSGVTVTVPYILGDGEMPEGVRVLALLDSSCFSRVDTEYSGAMATFEPGDCSRFSIGYGDAVTGDLNGDGLVNLRDYLLMKDVIADTASGIDLDAADTDGNGRVNLRDFLGMKTILEQR